MPAQPPISTENAVRGHRRKFSEEAKRLIVEEACQPKVSVSRVARRYGITTSLLFRWRQALGVMRAGEGGGFLPVTIADEAAVAAGDASGGRNAVSPSIIIERPAPGIEIELIGGRRVRFDRDIDPETVKRVVSALESETAP